MGEVLSGHRRRRLVGRGARKALVAGLVLVAGLPWVHASAQGRSGGPRATAPGEVETLAGPGFCAAGARRDASSTEVGAMAADADGRVFFETGPVRSGVVARVEPDGRVGRLVTGLERPPREHTATRAGGADRLAPDGEGGVLIAAGHQVMRVAPNNAVSVVAGTSSDGHTPGGDEPVGDGGPAGGARLRGAHSIVTDAAGDLYVADEIDSRLGTVRIRFVNRGSQPVSFYPGTPDEMVVAPGTIRTIAGVPGRTGGGDSGPASEAVVQGVPPSLAVVGPRLYLASSWAEPGLTTAETARVRMVNLGATPVTAHGVSVVPGAIETIAGGGPLGHSGDGGPARSAAFSRLPGIAADGDGNLYVADELNNRIRKVDPEGVVTTVAGRAGTGRHNAGFNGNDQPATQALLDGPVDVEVGSTGRLYVADRGNHQVRVVDQAGTIRAAPGSGIGLTWACDAPPTSPPNSSPEQPQPGTPAGVVADARGTVYVANAEAQQVVTVDPAGVVTTLVGQRRGDRTCLRTDSCPAVGDGGPAVDAELIRPTAVELTPGGEGLYIFDAVRVRFVNVGSAPVTVHGTEVDPGEIQTVAGNGVPGTEGDGGMATEGQLGTLDEQHRAQVSLAADHHGTLFIADGPNHRVRQVDPSGVVSTFAGTGAPAARARCCTDPVGLALRPGDNLYVADLGRDEISRAHPRVWLVNRGSGVASALGQQVDPGEAKVVAGNGSPVLGFEGDGGRAVEAQLPRLTGIDLDRAGHLFLAGVGLQEVDRNSQLVGGEGLVLEVDATGTIAVLMGNGQSGFNGDGLKPKLTSLNSPADVAVDACGNVLVADRGNDRVRRLNLAPCRLAVEPRAPTIDHSRQRGFTSVAGALMLVGGAAVALLVSKRYRRRRADDEAGDQWSDEQTASPSPPSTT